MRHGKTHKKGENLEKCKKDRKRISKRQKDAQDKDRQESKSAQERKKAREKQSTFK